MIPFGPSKYAIIHRCMLHLLSLRCLLSFLKTQFVKHNLFCLFFLSNDFSLVKNATNHFHNNSYDLSIYSASSSSCHDVSDSVGGIACAENFLSHVCSEKLQAPSSISICSEPGFYHNLRKKKKQKATAIKEGHGNGGGE